jgi:hypothetical protein
MDMTHSGANWLIYSNPETILTPDYQTTPMDMTLEGSWRKYTQC